MRLAFITSALILALLWPGSAALADGPDRYVIIQVTKTAYIWIVGAADFETCRILTEDIETVPQYADVAALCGIASTSLINDDAATIFYLGSYDYQEDIKVDLPQIIIKTDYQGSAVLVDAIDPLPNQAITRIEATINGVPSVCDTRTGGIAGPGGSLGCSFPVYNLPVLFSAYAASDYGDRSQIVRLRIAKSTWQGDPFLDPENQVVIIGDSAYTQYNNYHDIPGRWGVTPGPGSVPGWLGMVPTKNLETDHYYYYLSGQILLDRVVAAPLCHNGGISGQYANNCGVHAAFDAAYLYQNAYNADISAAADAAGVPNRLVKRIIAVESQFYPNALGIAGENGLYQFTRDGADTLLRWNGAAYLEVCGEYFDDCQDRPYDRLANWQRDVMANHILADPNNLYYLGAALKANAYQVDRLLDNILGIDHAGGSLDYVDLWKITISNYHTGATVTAAVFEQIDELGLDLTWDSFATVLDRLQPSGLHYVNMVTRGY